jgi:Tfp pilus assembly protein PilF
MAIHLLRTNSLILEVPKTGSKWVRLAVERAGIPHRHEGPPEWRGHGTLALHGRGFSYIACFVRHPVSWYRSYWAYRMEHGWNDHVELDRICRSDSFPEFIRKSTKLLPGVLTTVYETYAGPPDAPVHFVGKQENLAADLVVALQAAGEDFDETAIRSTPPTNQSSILCDYREELQELVFLSEFGAIRRYDYDGMDPFGIVPWIERHPEDSRTLRVLAINTEQQHVERDAATAAAGRPAGVGTRAARILCNFAVYMQAVKEDLEAAQDFYEAAVHRDPMHPRSLGHYAGFLHTVRHDYDRAEHHFMRALDVRPNHAVNLGKYALFMESVRGDTETAQRLYERALRLNPDHAENLGRYASFLMRECEDYARARTLLERAAALAPHDPTILCNYAVALSHCGEETEAERFFRAASAIEPPGASMACNFAIFLAALDRNAEAEQMFELAVSAAAPPASVFVAFALFLESEGDFARAGQLHRQALDMDPRDESIRAGYEAFRKQIAASDALRAGQ